jgi:hypothetical protein
MINKMKKLGNLLGLSLGICQKIICLMMLNKEILYFGNKKFRFGKIIH